jgi:hypothetical protein
MRLRIMLTGILSMLILAFVLVLPAAPVSAASSANCVSGIDTSQRNFLSFPTWYKYLPTQYTDAGGCNISTDFSEPPDGQADWDYVVPAVLLAVFEILLIIAGMVAVFAVIYGGFLYLMSTGEPEKAKNARTTIINALVGLMLAMLATVIVNLVAGNIAP